MVTDLCSIGTLFAFVLVCGGVLVLQGRKQNPLKPVLTPFINGKWIMVILLVIILLYYLI